MIVFWDSCFWSDFSSTTVLCRVRLPSFHVKRQCEIFTLAYRTSETQWFDPNRFYTKLLWSDMLRRTPFLFALIVESVIS